MNYIHETKEVLKNYRNLRIAVENLEDRLISLNSNLKCCDAIKYSDMPKGSGSSGAPDDNLLNTIFERDRTIELLEENKDKFKKLNDILDKLPNQYKDILIKSYSYEMLDNEIAKELNMSVRSIYSIKSKAIRMLAIQYFGIVAV